jgi:hypothetical protein
MDCSIINDCRLVFAHGCETGSGPARAFAIGCSTGENHLDGTKNIRKQSILPQKAKSTFSGMKQNLGSSEIYEN